MLQIKKTGIKAYLLGCIFFLQPFGSMVSNAQSFEGSITFQKITLSDTSYNVYHVKNKMVRVDELNNKKKMLSYHLIDLESKTITLINPEKNSFTNVPVRFLDKTVDTNIKIAKSENQKKIAGVNCTQWIAKNEKEKTQIVYWVANDQFDFFEQMLRIQNKTEKKNLYFLQIDQSQGFLPFEATERTMTWQVKTAMNVLALKKEKLNPGLFKVPTSYKDINK